MVEDFDYVLGEFASGVPRPDWLIGFAYSSVVEDETGVFIALVMAEMEGLTLPC